MAGVGGAPSGKQGMQADGRAGGARALMLGLDLSTTAALQHRACHAHQRNLRREMKWLWEFLEGDTPKKKNSGLGQLMSGLDRNCHLEKAWAKSGL